MRKRNTQFDFFANGRRRRSGMVLFLTIIILMLFSVISYTVVTKVGQYKRRQEYMMNYQISRYACDSAMRYALVSLEEINPRYTIRENQPDFSDLFAMTTEQEKDYLETWSELMQEKARQEHKDMQSSLSEARQNTESQQEQMALGFLADFLSMTFDPNSTSNTPGMAGMYDPNQMIIPGPYGAEWPYVVEPTELEIADAKVEIAISDENAKLPITWLILDDKNVEKEKEASFGRFADWMYITPDQEKLLKAQMEYIQDKKDFDLKPRPIVITEKTDEPVRTRSSSRARDRSRRTRRRTRVQRTTIDASRHTTDFVMLLQSSMLDREILTQPLPETGDRKEYPLKYLTLWGATQVNINTAPRHVLEAAFMFGGDETEIAESVILERRSKPFKNFEDLRERLYSYANSLEKSKEYIVFDSQYYMVQVKATVGSASATSVAAVKKQGRKVEKLAQFVY